MATAGSDSAATLMEPGGVAFHVADYGIFSGLQDENERLTEALTPRILLPCG